MEIDVAGEFVEAVELEAELPAVDLAPKNEANGLPSRDWIGVDACPDGFAGVPGRGGRGGLWIRGGRGGSGRWETPESE